MKKVIIFTILILSLVITGCIKKTAPALENTGEQTTDDKKHENTETQKQVAEDKGVPLTKADVVESVEGTEGWRVYEKKDMDVRLKYHKDWYYDRDEQAEKELGYDLYVGFVESAKLLEKGREYPIEFLILDKDIEWIYRGYLKEVANKYDKKYILRTGYKEELISDLDKMAESFEFISEISDPSASSGQAQQQTIE
ncbi:hypothetical protein KAU19_04515 [Candidatus Parcubacteria bacterium]|nr:hypothetical protein [Candidatus Parcubacteria bacterium]